MMEKKLNFTVRASDLVGFYTVLLNGERKTTSAAGLEAYKQFSVEGFPFSTFWLQFKDGKPHHVGEDRYRSNNAGAACKEYEHSVSLEEI
jgi:hypothetical protein